MNFKLPPAIGLKRLHYWLLVVLTLVSISSVQALSDRAAAQLKSDTRTAVLKNEQPLLPSVNTLHLLSFNQEPLLADLLWLQTIQYFGSGSPYGLYPALGPMADRITELDPKFPYPYQFGMVVLPFMKQADTAEKLGLRARENLPNDGLLTYYLATVYHLNIRDYKKAAEYYDIASTLPGSPAAAKTLAESARSQVAQSMTDSEVAKTFWRTAAQQARNDDEQERALRWLAHFEIVQSIEIANKQFKDQTGRYALSLQELVDSGKLSVIPTSPMHRKLILDPTTGQVNFDEVEDGI